MHIELGILAAGQSTRFGSPKQLALFEGVSLIEKAVRSAQAVSDSPWLVLGAHADQVKAKAALSGTKLIVAEAWQQGMSATIRALVQAIQNRAAPDGLIMMLVDQPLIAPEDINAVMAAAERLPDKPVLCEYASGQCGPPVYFPASWFERLCSLKGDQGARYLLREGSSGRVKVGHRGFDVDTRDDLVRLQSLTS